MKVISACIAAIFFICLVGAADYHEDIFGNCSGNPVANRTVVATSSPWSVQERFVEAKVQVGIEFD